MKYKVFLKNLGMAATGLSLLSIPPVLADVKMGAKMLVEHGYYNGVHHKNGESGSGNEIRLVRVYFKGKFDQHWENMIQLQISEEAGSTKTIWKEAYLKYNGLGPFDITIGKRKEPFGLQMLVNAERVLLLERAMISSALAPERSIGVTLSAAPGNSSFELGLYSQDNSGNAAYAKGAPEADNPEEDTYAVTGRFTYTPWQQEHSLIHLGLAGSHRNFGGNEFQLKDRAEIHLAQQIVTSGTTVADNLNLFGVEVAAQFGPVSFQSEYMQLLVNAEDGDEDAEYDGYYAQIGYLLTNGYRNYSKGKFGEIVPTSKVGAWQLMGRYSVLNAEDNNEGVQAENIVLGVNWFANTSARISANYIKTQLDNVDPENDDGDAFAIRFQYVF
jgi:phosphate-selective porin OprO/OprP